jgi:hypothetical protein
MASPTSFALETYPDQDVADSISSLEIGQQPLGQNVGRQAVPDSLGDRLSIVTGQFFVDRLIFDVGLGIAGRADKLAGRVMRHLGV